MDLDFPNLETQWGEECVCKVIKETHMRTRMLVLFSFHYSKQSSTPYLIFTPPNILLMTKCARTYFLCYLWTDCCIHQFMHKRISSEKEPKNLPKLYISFLGVFFLYCQQYRLHKWKMFFNGFWDMNISINSECPSQAKMQNFFSQRRTILLWNLFFIPQDVVYSECKYKGRKDHEGQNFSRVHGFRWYNKCGQNTILLIHTKTCVFRAYLKTRKRARSLKIKQETDSYNHRSVSFY